MCASAREESAEVYAATSARVRGLDGVAAVSYVRCGGRAVVNVALYVPSDTALPRHVDRAARGKDCAHRIEETGWGPHRVFTFFDVSRSLDLVLRMIGELACIPGTWATVGGQRMSSLVALWNRLDCYRQSLSHVDRIAYCREKAARLKVLLGCDAACCTTPCQFVCPECTARTHTPTESLVYPETQMLLVFGEVEWCPNLVPPAQS